MFSHSHLLCPCSAQYEDDCEDFTTYPKAKFISEFGSQSYPTFATYAEATSVKDWQVDNPMTGFRNRRFGNGLEMFEKQFKRHFRLPASCECLTRHPTRVLLQSSMTAAALLAACGVALGANLCGACVTAVPALRMS